VFEVSLSQFMAKASKRHGLKPLSELSCLNAPTEGVQSVVCVDRIELIIELLFIGEPVWSDLTIPNPVALVPVGVVVVDPAFEAGPIPGPFIVVPEPAVVIAHPNPQVVLPVPLPVHRAAAVREVIPVVAVAEALPLPVHLVVAVIDSPLPAIGSHALLPVPASVRLLEVAFVLVDVTIVFFVVVSIAELVLKPLLLLESQVGLHKLLVREVVLVLVEVVEDIVAQLLRAEGEVSSPYEGVEDVYVDGVRSVVRLPEHIPHGFERIHV